MSRHDPSYAGAGLPKPIYDFLVRNAGLLSYEYIEFAELLRAHNEAIIQATWHFMDLADSWPDLEPSEINHIIAAAEQEVPS